MEGAEPRGRMGFDWGGIEGEGTPGGIFGVTLGGEMGGPRGTSDRGASATTCSCIRRLISGTLGDSEGRDGFTVGISSGVEGIGDSEGKGPGISEGTGVGIVVGSVSGPLEGSNSGMGTGLMEGTSNGTGMGTSEGGESGCCISGFVVGVVGEMGGGIRSGSGVGLMEGFTSGEGSIWGRITDKISCCLLESMK
jgi:hypothetical protein